MTGDLRSGADLRLLLPLAGVAGDELELAPASGGPLVTGEPFLEPALQPCRVTGVSGGLELVLGPVLAEHFEVKSAGGHARIVPAGEVA